LSAAKAGFFTAADPGFRSAQPGLRARITLPLPTDVLDDGARLAAHVDIGRTDRHLAEAARDVEHVGRLREAGEAPAQRAHQRLALRDRRAEM
jgi:hypothetical protein